MKPLSGKQAVKHLTRDFGFEVTRQKGSHIMLSKRISDRTLVTVVPDHKELAPGTMRAILQQTGISREEWEEVAG
jgi:predicted RNA binding protein YcfA (HicA-like mRNA interferase family)